MEELLHCYTQDGIALEGALYPGSSELVVVYTHGVTGSVFRATHVRIARALQHDGWTVLAGNNRGNGVATPLLQRVGPRLLGGSWYERLADAVTDIAAWIDVAAARGARRVALLGHSLGAVKTVLYATEREDDRVAALVLASPAFRFVSRFGDRGALERARRAVDAGRPDELIEHPALAPTFGRISAAAYLDRASGYADPWAEPDPRLARIRCPILAIYGTNEPDIGGAEELARIGRLARVEYAGTLIEGADHVYTGHEREAADVISRWLRVQDERLRTPATT